MAIPTSYDEISLADFMLRATGAVATGIGWTDLNFAEAIVEVLIALDIDDLADAVNIPKLRAIARVEAWRAVVDGTVADIKFSADGGSFDMQQRHSQALASLARAQEAAAQYAGNDTGYAVTMGTMTFVDTYGTVDVYE